MPKKKLTKKRVLKILDDITFRLFQLWEDKLEHANSEVKGNISGLTLSKEIEFYSKIHHKIAKRR